MRLTKPLAGLAVASIALLSACGGSGGAPSTEQSIGLNDTAGKDKDPNAVGPLTIDGATPGGTVNVIAPTGGLSTTLDPRGAYYSDVLSVLTNLLTRSLTQWKYDDETKNMVLVPDLATNLGTPNANNTQWTFKLKDGIKYQDGTPIKSEDIAYAVSSSLDCDTFSDCPSNYLLGTLKGVDGVKKDGDIASGIQTPDDSTIIFNFKTPFPDMPYYGFFPLFSPIPESVGKNISSYPNNLVATGPYKISKFVPGKTLDLVRNTNWDPNSDPARAALPDAWNFDTTYTDPKKVDAIIAAGQGDGATTMSYNDIDSSDVQNYQTKYPDQIAQGPTPLTTWLAPDNTTVPKAVREALTYAYPYLGAAKAAGLIPGVNWDATTTLEAPGVPGRQEVNGVPDHKVGTTDAAKAKSILQAAGKLGFKLTFLYKTDDPQSVNAMKVIKGAYEEAGFDAQPVAVTSADYAAKRSDPTTPINVRVGGWFSDWPSGYSWIIPVFQPADTSVSCAKQTWESFGVVNYAKYCSDSANKQMTAIQAMPVEDQPAAWSALEKTIQTTDYPIIPLYNGGTIQPFGKGLGGVHIDVTGGMPTYKTIYVK